MKRHPWGLFALVLTALLLGCYGSESEDTAAQGEAPPPKLAIPVIPAEGTEFDPPVQMVQLPPDVWYCDMGTVHYARGEKADGICPLCGMNLVYKAPEDPEADSGP